MEAEVSLVRSGGYELEPAEFAAGLARADQNRATLMAWVRGNLVDGTDYGTIQVRGRASKPSLWKPGAEKIAGMLRLRATFRRDAETWEMLGSPAGTLCYVCELVDESGVVRAEGRGARSVDPDGDANKAIKMAQKSAQIDAVLRCAGLSEVFTQDLEDLHPPAAQGRRAQPAGAKESVPPSAGETGGSKAPAGPARSTGVISDKQGKRLWAIAKSREQDIGVGADHIVRTVFEGYGIEHTASVPWKLYDEIVGKIESYEPPIEAAQEEEVF